MFGWYRDSSKDKVGLEYAVSSKVIGSRYSGAGLPILPKCPEDGGKTA